MSQHRLLLENVLEETALVHLATEANALIAIARHIPGERLSADRQTGLLNDLHTSRYTVSLAESVICLPTHEAIRAFAS
ncbi:MAG: hypothetical protein K2X01_04230 [Cyanobacteria bacterium]|nr:hypothetical protein [Cyanobacteriota bacterium]